MRNQSKYLLLIAVLLAVYYVVCGFYLNHLGYYSQEALFYMEKAKIILNGSGDRLRVMGLTAPILPFYSSFIFSYIHFIPPPVVASSLCVAALFYLMASTLIRRTNDMFYILVLLITFLLHPGILYAATSGKSIALVLVFFFLFFFNLLKFYRSNTTFHVSIASLCLVILIFCDYKFIWLTLFFIPLVLSITIKSLNLGEQESIFRLHQSFNNPSLRRKLINKTFALYIILFILPISCVICYKLLNLTHAQDLDYFNQSPYATWTVLADKLSFDTLSTGAFYQIPETSVLISLKMLIFCPLMIIAIFLFRDSTYQILTLLTPFAFIEFLHIKYDKVFLPQEYYLMFLVLALLCILYRAQIIKRQGILKLVVIILTIVQLVTGYLFLRNSSIDEERHFISVIESRNADTLQDQNRQIAKYINHLPERSYVLIDDAIAYPIVTFTNNIGKLILPYREDDFLGTLEAPNKYAGNNKNTYYILLASDKNAVTGFTQLNEKYIPAVTRANSALKFRRVFETDDWVLYKIFSNN